MTFCFCCFFRVFWVVHSSVFGFFVFLWLSKGFFGFCTCTPNTPWENPKTKETKDRGMKNQRNPEENNKNKETTDFQTMFWFCGLKSKAAFKNQSIVWKSLVSLFCLFSSGFLWFFKALSLVSLFWGFSQGFFGNTHKRSVKTAHAQTWTYTGMQMQTDICVCRYLSVHVDSLAQGAGTATSKSWQHPKMFPWSPTLVLTGPWAA